MRGEKMILLECIELYKNYTCLWDNRDEMYNNKTHRERAYEVILERYREMVNDATVIDLKKKLDNMRTSFRREHRKVLLSQKRNEYPIHQPSLWYYEHLLFLNEVGGYHNIDLLDASTVDDNDNGSTDDCEPPRMKKIKRSNSSNTVFLIEEPNARSVTDEHVDDFVNETGTIHSEDANRSNRVIDFKDVDTLEAEAFGNLVGHQLKQLDCMQRTIAEKLISDIIFYARINKLSTDSSVNI